MHDYSRLRPVKRSRIRLAAGKRWFTAKRYARWIFSRGAIAKEKSDKSLPCRIFAHATPLYRQLRDVELWMHTNKTVNLKLAAERLDGLLLKPGETFSYWRTIGKPTKRKGYADGMVLFYGSYKAGIGGGLCQMSNLIYWMALHTPLRVTERHRHSYDVFPDAGRTQPFGSGATCAYNYLDLQIHNPTADAYQLRVRVTDNELVGEWRSTAEARRVYEVYEKDHRIESLPWGGYLRSNLIHRYVYGLEGEVLSDEYVTENRALMMYSPLLEPTRE
ncbi:VanW family protein [Paenibacillus arenilitoris]|uniref:VanW family protein n=1 Tax=Paenibacillus arenilitoris TaxID=2772299 RepID=A0A927H933_9BACL|nr:VanW family protein [Paenibacillus arenilitoris]MBD2871204.1 VanW family protein [Paenibacillus arenilitoris]